MYFHIYNRGNRKGPIFYDDLDRIRFLFTILIFQFDIKITKTKKILRNITCLDDLITLVQPWRLTKNKRLVKLHTFCLMPNHFHIILEELETGSRSNYMMRVLDSYTKYFNSRYKLVGHVFQGNYRSKIIDNDLYLLALSAYIHNNPLKLNISKEKQSELIKWSSYYDYTVKNRWGIFLETETISIFFKDKKDYSDFVLRWSTLEVDH